MKLWKFYRNLNIHEAESLKYKQKRDAEWKRRADENLSIDQRARQ
jgi:hypothetical protein